MVSKSGKASPDAKAGKASMMGGLKRTNPSSSDASTQLKMSPSVDKDATRASTAETPKTLGPRTA